MNRGDLQRLAEARLREARVLLEAGEFSGAYYLAGYAVECALKACFAKTVKRFDFPDRSMNKLFTHGFNELIKIVELKTALDEAMVNADFRINWNLVCSWTAESRYARWTARDASEILDAIGDPKNGVLPWIKRRW